MRVREATPLPVVCCVHVPWGPRGPTAVPHGPVEHPGAIVYKVVDSCCIASVHSDSRESIRVAEKFVLDVPVYIITVIAQCPVSGASWMRAFGHPQRR